MDKSKLFHKVANHLLTQNRCSMAEDNTCMYRGLDGTSCAVGCLIPDRLYTKRIEGVGAQVINGCHDSPRERAFVRIMKKAIGKVDDQTAGMIRQLQVLHDEANDVTNPRMLWCDGLLRIARSRDIRLKPQLARRIAAFKAANTRKKKNGTPKV